MFDASTLHHTAKKICKKERFTPRKWERLNADKPLFHEPIDCDYADYKVLRIWNSHREIVITAMDMADAEKYL